MPYLASTDGVSKTMKCEGTSPERSSISAWKVVALTMLLNVMSWFFFQIKFITVVVAVISLLFSFIEISCPMARIRFLYSCLFSVSFRKRFGCSFFRLRLFHCFSFFIARTGEFFSDGGDDQRSDFHKRQKTRAQEQGKWDEHVT